MKDVRDVPGTAPRIALVKAVLAVVQDDAPKAVEIASDGLLNHPEELALFLPLLQEILLTTGQFSRTVPILERACQSESAPPSMWVDLALLYEKVGDRDRALRFLETKAGRPAFTPDAAAPYLRQLVGDDGDTDFARLWRMLAMPVPPRGWSCRDCGRRDERIRWFCPDCLAFHSYRAGEPDGPEA
jgi:lipopolysaccharide biosynthesis regulator YciM